jgi:hypothetical protein
MWKLLHGLIWPAVGGSVVWAFFTVAIEKWSEINDHGHLVFAQLVSLLSFAVYLSADWLYTNKKEINMRPCCWPFDALLAITITVSTISLSLTHIEVNVAKWSMALCFMMTAIGHLSGAWEENLLQKREVIWFNRAWLAVINLFGLVILLVFQCNPSLWPLSIAVAIVVFLYILFVEYIMKNLKSENNG